MSLGGEEAATLQGRFDGPRMVCVATADKAGELEVHLAVRWYGLFVVPENLCPL
jgi:hypothetical protein